MVIGMGETGRDIVRFLYEYGAFMSCDSNNEHVRRSEFHCYVVDRNIDTLEGSFALSAPKVMKARNADGSKMLDLISADTSSIAFCEDVLSPIAYKLNYVAITMGSDDENMALAIRLLKFVMMKRRELENFCIFVRVYDNSKTEHFKKVVEHYNNAIRRECLKIFGSYDEIFDYSIIVEDNFRADAKQFYERYQKVMQENEPVQQNGTWDERRDELLGFCRKVVGDVLCGEMMQRYNQGKPINEKGCPTGLTIAFEYAKEGRWEYPKYKNLRKLRRQTQQDMSNAWHKLTKLELIRSTIQQNTTFSMLHDSIAALPEPKSGDEYKNKYKPLGDKLSTLILNLAITEHLRWNASHEMLGYVKGDSTVEEKQTHNCLVDWEELDQVSAVTCKASRESTKTWDYPFHSDIVDKHPNFKNWVRCNVMYLPDYKKYDFAVVETTLALLAQEEKK